MKLRSRALPIVAGLALLASACADGEGDDGTDPVDDVEEDMTDDESAGDDGDGAGADEDPADGEDDPADGEEDPADDEEDRADGEEDPAASGDGEADDGSAATTAGLDVAESDLGEHLVTAEGETVYAAVDQQDGEVVCTGSCAQVWPPVIVDGDAEAGDGVDAALVDTVELADGQLQVVYGDAPLHTFVSDDGSVGSMTGHGSADRWWVVGPDGALIDAPEPGADEED